MEESRIYLKVYLFLKYWTLGSDENIDVANYCDVCSDVKEIKETASMFCFDCEQYLCNVCGNSHTRLTVARSHKVVSIEGFKIIMKDVNANAEKISKLQENKKYLKITEFMSRMDTLSADVTNRGKYIKSRIDSQTKSLLIELVNVRD